jgi:hypothetical protein
MFSHCQANSATWRSRLVVDAIGLSDKTFVDGYRTPRTEKLHVVERWRVIDGGKVLEVNVKVDDPVLRALVEEFSAMTAWSGR